LFDHKARLTQLNKNWYFECLYISPIATAQYDSLFLISYLEYWVWSFKMLLNVIWPQLLLLFRIEEILTTGNWSIFLQRYLKLKWFVSFQKNHCKDLSLFTFFLYSFTYFHSDPSAIYSPFISIFALSQFQDISVESASSTVAPGPNTATAQRSNITLYTHKTILYINILLKSVALLEKH
jgi:hypothetical protein